MKMSVRHSLASGFADVQSDVIAVWAVILVDQVFDCREEVDERSLFSRRKSKEVRLMTPRYNERVTWAQGIPIRKGHRKLVRREPGASFYPLTENAVPRSAWHV